MKKSIFGIVLSFLVIAVFADEPLLNYEKSYTVSSSNGKYYLYLDYDNNKTSCYLKSEEETSPIWEISKFYGAAGTVFLDDSGTYFTVCHYPDLIPQNYKKNWIIFTVYKNGIEYAKIKFSDVIKDTKKLVETVSHFRWGHICGIYEKGMILDTVEGIKIYNFQKKSFLPLSDKRNITAWTEEELLESSLDLISSDGKIERYFDFSDFGAETIQGKSVAATLGTITEKEFMTEDGEKIIKREISVVPPELFWRIDASGVLELSSDDLFRHNVTRISKLCYSPDKKKVYAIEGKEFVVFKYGK